MSHEMSKEDFDNITNVCEVLAPHLRRAITHAMIESHMALHEMLKPRPNSEQLPVNRESMEMMLWGTVYGHAIGKGSGTPTLEADYAREAFNKRFPK